MQHVNGHVRHTLGIQIGIKELIVRIAEDTVFGRKCTESHSLYGETVSDFYLIRHTVDIGQFNKFIYICFCRAGAVKIITGRVLAHCIRILLQEDP